MPNFMPITSDIPNDLMYNEINYNVNDYESVNECHFQPC